MVTIDVHDDGEQCWFASDCDEQHHQETIFGDWRDQVRAEIFGE
jgi:hypothetical protein